MRSRGSACELPQRLRAKTVLSDSGAMQIDVPRDPAGSFELLLVPKRQKKLPGFEEKIIALYARSMTVRDIKAMFEAQYHIEVSTELLL
jgi:transposase-like protein